MQEIFAAEFAKATRDNLRLTMESWHAIMEDKN